MKNNPKIWLAKHSSDYYYVAFERNNLTLFYSLDSFNYKNSSMFENKTLEKRDFTYLRDLSVNLKKLNEKPKDGVCIAYNVDNDEYVLCDLNNDLKVVLGKFNHRRLTFREALVFTPPKSFDDSEIIWGETI